MNSRSSFRLSFLFIAAGLLFFALFHVLSLSSAAGWVNLPPRSPRGWTQAHLLVLGWGTLVAMGAVYQLLSVVLQHTVFSLKLGYAQAAATIIGVAGLLAGFYSADFRMIGGFASLAFIGVLLFVLNITVTLVRANKWDPITISTQCALIYLLLTAIIGMLMGLDFVYNNLGGWHERLFGTHIWLGAAGWFGLLITGFSYKLLPMFYLAHNYPVKLQKFILILWNLGVAAGAAAWLFGASEWVKYLAWLILAAALILYTVHAFQIRRFRHKANPGAGVVFTLYLLSGLTLLAIAFAAVFPFLAARGIPAETYTFIGWMYLAGWVGLTILSYMSKIVPFLWWTQKYGSLVGKRNVPKLAEMIPDRWVGRLLMALSASLAVMLIGIAWRVPALSDIGGSAFSLFSLVYMGLIVRVFTR